MQIFEQEPTPRFSRNSKSEQPIGENTGFHSDLIRGVTESGQEYLIKRYGVTAGGYEKEHADSIVDHMNTFRALAKGINVSVAQTFSFEIEPHEDNGRVHLLEIVPYGGRDLRTVFADPAVPDHEVLQHSRDYLAMFKTVQEHGSPISLDPPPANFCVTGNPDSPLVYVDLMPPRYKQDGQVIVSEWPEPPEESKDFIHKRYFGMEQSRVIYAQLLRALNGRSFSTDQIKAMMREELGEDAYEMVSFSDEQKREALSMPLRAGPDVLRIIAAEGYHNGFYTRDQLHRVYGSTHIGIGGILPTAEEMYGAVHELSNGRYNYIPLPYQSV